MSNLALSDIWRRRRWRSMPLCSRMARKSAKKACGGARHRTHTRRHDEARVAKGRLSGRRNGQ
eukprot:7385222-Prymnesium_polylepis.1